MRVLIRELFNVKRGDVFNLYPLGDIHDGAAACDEKLLRRIVDRINKDDGARWIGTGDYCDFINPSDKRFSFATLADWIEMPDLLDLPKAQVNHLLDILRPIASKCLGLACGNHEMTIQAKYERNIYSEIVTGIKEAGGFPADHKLALGYYGWVMLNFYRSSKKRQSRTTIKANVHHGFVGGRLAGAKALNMQRWLWTHDADLVIFGHSHNQMAQPETVEKLDRNGKLVQQVRRGCYGGTFLKTVNEDGPSTYSERKGYFPLPVGNPVIRLRPGAEAQRDRVRIVI